MDFETFDSAHENRRRMLYEEMQTEIRKLRRDRDRLESILARRAAHAWNEELGYSVALENREMVDAWLEW